ncbi:MAG: Cytidyltransferase-related protein [Candidatus Saccharibacteria bacterium]|nr:Cytidyltransferase-related protein [Candidatus Saccharibacteria bacterium]
MPNDKKLTKKARRIGIYAGTFNPVHAGHVAFALQALKSAKLDCLYFLPERQPRHKKGAEHFGHRVAMLERATQPHPQFGVLELPDGNFSVQRTLPRLKKLYPNDQLVFLFGSDVVHGLGEWPYAAQLLKSSEIVVGLRSGGKTKKDVQHVINGWQQQPKKVVMFESFAPDISSGMVREALRKRQYVRGLLASVARYSNRHWLYVSLAQS